MCTFFLVVAFRDARFLSGLYGRFSYILYEDTVEDTKIRSKIPRYGRRYQDTAKIRRFHRIY